MEQPAEGQDPQVTQTTTPPAEPQAGPSTTPVGSGPWANDLAQAFADPTIRANVDSFLREKVQPYNTRLEQEAASAKQAMNLWTSLEQNPIDTYVQMTHELYGEAAASAVLDALQTTLQQPQAAQPQAPQQPPSQVPGLDPRLENIISWAEQQQQAQTYESEMARISTENPDLKDEIDRGLLHMFVAGAGGNFDEAVNAYRQFKEQYGVPQQSQAPPPPEAPQVMGSDTGGAASATPVAPRHESLDEAINGFMAEQRAARQAPPVGVA